MTLLGIETSAVTCSAAVMRDGAVLASFSRRDGLTHSETLLPGILSILNEAGLTIDSIDAVAAAAGPGSFTGLRIGIATAKGLSYDRDLPCVPVSTLEALAENARGLEGYLVCAVMDARRGEFYNALFSAKDGFLRRLTEDRAVTGNALARELAAGDKIVILGDGAEKFTALYPDLLPCLAPEEIRWQSAESVCRVAARRFEIDKVSCRLLAPRYLRLPQAEREWRRKQEQE